MKSPKNLLSAALAAVAAILAVVASHQHVEIERLRTEAQLAQDHIQKRAIAAERRAASLQQEVVAARQQGGKERPAPDESPKGETPPNPRRMMANAAEMMNRPEVQKAMAIRTRAMLDANHAALFKQLKLAPDKLEQLKQLMVERQQVGSDVFAAAAQQGIDPVKNGRELAKLTAEGQAKVDHDVKSLLGDDDYSAYQNYQATLPHRNLVNQLQQSLSYTPSPLSDAQSEQLVQILAQNPPARPANSPTPNMVFARTSAGGPGMAPEAVSYVGPAPGGAPITDNAVNAARVVLTDPQVEALQQLQQQQAQLRALAPPRQPGANAAVIQVTSGPDGGTAVAVPKPGP